MLPSNHIQSMDDFLALERHFKVNFLERQVSASVSLCLAPLSKPGHPATVPLESLKFGMNRGFQQTVQRSFGLNFFLKNSPNFHYEFLVLTGEMYGNVAHPARHPIYIAWFYKSIFGHQDGPRPLFSQAAEEELAPNEASFREARCSNGTFHHGDGQKTIENLRLLSTIRWSTPEIKVCDGV
jgi:hypothetical protein